MREQGKSSATSISYLRDDAETVSPNRQFMGSRDDDIC